MGICEYKKKVREQLDEVMEKPVTLGRMEEAGIMAGLLCHLDKISAGYDTEGLSEGEARAWVAGMENEDGSFGEHWTEEQTSAAAWSIGVDLSVVGASTWYATMNMMYSDYYGVIHEFGMDRPDLYAKLAQAFLMDKDAGGAQKKVADYFHCVVKK